ncbi:FIG00732574: hypothetical protein [Klebsiella pneumoniae IS46]|nr:FIG00732574: hypothetical protein [Klebsiella pneumoniae IS46]
MFDRLFSRSRQKISKNFFPTRFAGYPDRRLWQKKKKRASSHFHHILSKNVP